MQGTPVTPTFLGLLLVIGIGLAALRPSVQSLVASWNDYDRLTYTHGYLVAAICLWLLWRARHRLVASAAPGGSMAGAAATAVATIVWAVAWLAGIEVGFQLMLPVALLAAVWAFAGPRTAVVAALPIGYLVFAIPVWDQVNGLLQMLTVKAVTLFLKAIAIPAFFQGNHVHLGSGTFEIAGGCSGLHFFIVATSIGVLYGELGYDSTATRVKLVLIAAIMAIVANWIRVATIIVAGYLTDMQTYLVRVDHYYFGWALFGVLLAAYFWFVPRWLNLRKRPEPPLPAPSAAPRTGNANLAAGAVTVVAMLIVPLYVTRAQAHARSEAGSNDATVRWIEPEVPGWRGPLRADERWKPQYPQADRTLRTAYERDGGRVEAFVATYGYQAQGKEMVGYGNDLLGRGGWRRVSSGVSAGDPAARRPATAQETVVDGYGQRWLLLHFYDVGGRTFSTGMTSKLYYPLALVAGRTDSRIVAVATRCEADCTLARARVESFVRDAGDELRRVGGVRGSEQ